MAAPTFIAAIRPTVTWGVNATATRTTASFSVTAGDVLVVLAAAEDASSTFSGISGGSLTWTQQENVGTATATARAALYTATAASTTTITVSLTISNSAANWGFVVHQYRGSTGVGAHASQAGGTSGVAPSQALTTTGANSAISALIADWTATDGSSTRAWRAINGITPTAGNGLETDYFRDPGGTSVTIYAGYWNDAGAAGAKTVGLTAPTMRPAIVTIEILGGGAAASSLLWTPDRAFQHMLLR